MSNAFPEDKYFDEHRVVQAPGLTKREYFAIKILQGLIINKARHLYPEFVKESVEIADQLIQELNKG